VGAKTDRHPVRSDQQVDGRNRNENPVAGRGTRAGRPAQNLPKRNGIEITRSGDFVQNPWRFDYDDKHVMYDALAMPRPNGFAPSDRGKATAMPDIHIIPSGDRWNVKQENGDVVSAHRDEGEFSRIRKGDQV
jgi:hypothetical protein